MLVQKQAKGYVTEEVIEFCVDYMDELCLIGVPISRHEGRLIGKGILGKKSVNANDLKRTLPDGTCKGRRKDSSCLELSITTMLSSMENMTPRRMLKMCMQYTVERISTSVSSPVGFYKCRQISRLLHFINQHSIFCVLSNICCIM